MPTFNIDIQEVTRESVPPLLPSYRAATVNYTVNFLDICRKLFSDHKNESHPKVF